MFLKNRNNKNIEEIEKCFTKYSSNVEIVDLNPISIPKDSDIVRDMPRPIELREELYEEKFDSKTLFYDVFQNENIIYLIGPPLYNLQLILEKSEIYIDNIKIDSSSIIFGKQRKYSVTKIEMNSKYDRYYRIKIINDHFNTETYISRNRIEDQVGKNVLVAINKNNKIDWIYDWAKYYYYSEGIDTVIIYDNDSTEYSLEQLAKKLSIMHRIKFYLIKTPFPFGPQGGWLDLNGELTKLPFDSFYLQAAMLSHARFYFCNKADFYINVDIDELVLVKTGGTIKAKMKEQNLNYLCFPQVYVYSKTIDEELKIADVYFKEIDYTYGCQKWACFPNQIEEKLEFDIHAIHGLKSTSLSSVIKYHLYPISSNWRGNRDSKTLSEQNGTISRDLAIKFNNIFNTNIPVGDTKKIIEKITSKYGPSNVEILKNSSLKLSLSEKYSYVIEFSEKSSVVAICIVAYKNSELMEMYSLLQHYMLISPPDTFTGAMHTRNRLEVVNIQFDNIDILDIKIYNAISNLESIIGKYN